MTAFLYILNTLCASGQSVLGKQYAANGGRSADFNLNKALAGSAVFLIFGIMNGMRFHFYTLLFGACYGIFLCLSMYAGFKALAMGPMTLTSIIASFSLIIPFLFGVAVFGESVTPYNIAGLLLLLSAIVLLNIKKEKNFSAKWLFFALLTMLANGLCSLVQKYHQLYFTGRYTVEFSLYSFITVLVILSCFRLGSEHKFKFGFSGLAAGAMNGIANYIVLYLAGSENATVLFPIVSIINIIAVWILGRLLFKEQLKPLQALGLIFGIVSVVLLKI